MHLSLKPNELQTYVQKQLENFFPDRGENTDLASVFPLVLERLEHCFSSVYDKYFQQGGVTQFNHLHSDQYAMFLYFMANSLYKKQGACQTCEKLYYLNKILNGLDVYYSVELPSIFVFSHPLGTILGRAQYSDYLVVYQNCTVGSNHEVDYPTLGEHVSLYRGAAILGKCRVGNRCKIAADSTLLDQDLPDNSIYIGKKNADLIKPLRKTDSIWDPK